MSIQTAIAMIDDLARRPLYVGTRYYTASATLTIERKGYVEIRAAGAGSANRSWQGNTSYGAGGAGGYKRLPVQAGQQIHIVIADVGGTTSVSSNGWTGSIPSNKGGWGLEADSSPVPASRLTGWDGAVGGIEGNAVLGPGPWEKVLGGAGNSPGGVAISIFEQA